MAMSNAGGKGTGGSLVTGLLGIFLVGLVACASKQPSSPAPTVTSEQVRGHADKAFDKLKQEERDRTKDPAASN